MAEPTQLQIKVLRTADGEPLRWSYTTVHFSGTVNGGISCNGYRGEVPPGAAHTTNRAHVTCEDCWELMEEHV